MSARCLMLVLAACNIPAAPGSMQTATANKAATPLPAPTIQLIRGMALTLIPRTYIDEDDWGAEKRIQSGLNVKMDKLKLRTSRRWKNVNHGIWRRVEAHLSEPETHFHLAVSTIPQQEDGTARYLINSSMRLQLNARQQHWNLGVKLYSISADAVADVSLAATVSFQSELRKTDDGTRLRIVPAVESTNLQLTRFRLQRISHTKGSVAREFGNTFESLIKRAVRKKGRRLPSRINAKIAKKSERFEVPAGLLALFAADNGSIDLDSGDPDGPSRESDHDVTGSPAVLSSGP